MFLPGIPDCGRATSAQCCKGVEDRFDLGFFFLFLSFAFSSSIRFRISAAGSSLGLGSASSPW